MSYARWSDSSDVYVYAHVDGFVRCEGCWVDLHSADEVVAHMSGHVERGDLVPTDLLDTGLYPSEDFKPYPDDDGAPVVVMVGRFEMFVQGLVLGYLAGRVLLLIADLVRAVRTRKR